MSDPGSVPPAGQLAVERLEDGRVRVIGLTGELDLATAAELESALAEAIADAEPRVLLDLTGLAFIDSTGLAAIIRAHGEIAEAGGRFVVACVDGAVRRTIETTGLGELLALSSSRRSAVRDLKV